MSEPPSEIEAAFASFADYLNAATVTIDAPLPDAHDGADDFVTPVVVVPGIWPTSEPA